MLVTFLGVLYLFISLWWLWLILFSPVFLILAWWNKIMSPLLVLLFIGGAAYLILTPVEGLQVAVPAFVSTPSPLQIGEIGMPVADKIEWNSLPAFYELTNQLVIPLLKQYWLYWIPFWILVLLISRFTPEKEG